MCTSVALCEVRVGEQVKLPPNSDTIVSANVCMHLSTNPTDTIGLLEPHAIEERDIQAPVAIWATQNNTIPVILRNATNTEIPLAKDALIGTFYPIVGSSDDEFKLLHSSNKHVVSSLETNDSDRC